MPIEHFQDPLRNTYARFRNANARVRIALLNSGGGEQHFELKILFHRTIDKKNGRKLWIDGDYADRNTNGINCGRDSVNEEKRKFLIFILQKM